MAEVLTDDQVRLRLEIEDFFYREADLLDDREYDKWLDLFTEDARYWMPMRRNVSSEELDHENTTERHEMSWFDEGKPTLIMRVQQIKTGVHWAEEPYSRVSHLVSNVRVLDSTATGSNPASSSTAIAWRMRRASSSASASTLFAAKARTGKIARREIYLDQSVMLSKNFTVFF